MELTLPGENSPTRIWVKDWIKSNPNATSRELAQAGLVAPHWPKPYGLDATPIDQLIIDEELRGSGIKRPENIIGIGWAGPTILHAGTKEQKDRYLLPLLSGEEIWCQLFSEPDAGSDLASLSTKAVQDGDDFIVNGQKIWTSMGHFAKFGILLARTNSDVPKHQGISYFILDMKSPGVSVTPIVDMTGMHTFNQVFFTDVRVPKDNLVGELNKGWELAKVTLANERVSLSSGGSLWGRGPTSRDLIDLLRMFGGVNDPLIRQRVAEIYSEGEILKWLTLRQISKAIKGAQPGHESSVKKALGDEHGQKLMNLANDIAGMKGSLESLAGIDSTSDLSSAITSWYYGFLFSAALTIGGGTSEVQRNIIAERTFNLPKEFDASSNKPFNS